MMTGYRSDNPDAVVFVALEDVMGGAKLYLTDNAWTGTEFKTNEGTKEVGSSNASIFCNKCPAWKLHNSSLTYL